MKRRVIKKVNIFFERVLHVFYAAFSVLSRKSKREQVRLERMAAREEAEQKKIIEKIEEEKESVFRKKEAIERQLEAEARAEATELDKQIAQVQRSTRTSFKKLAPVHNYLRTKSKLYYVWHLNPYSSSLHFGALLFFVVTSVYFLQAIYPAMYQKALADAKTCTWKGTNSTSWEDADNWSNCSSGVPGAEDYIVFDSTATQDLILTSDQSVARVSSLDAGNFSRTFNTNGQILTISETLTWQDGTLSAGSSEIKVAGDVDLLGTAGSGTFTYSTSTLTLTGSASNFTPKANLDLYALKINKDTNSTAVTINTNNFNIRDDLIIQKGKLDGSGRTVSLTRDDCRYNIGDSTGGSATIAFNTSTGNQYLDGSGGTANDNVVINKTAGTLYYNGTANLKYLTLTDGALNIQSGNLTFPASADGSAGKLSCAASKTLTIAGSSSRIVTLRSATPGSTWYFENNCGLTTADYLDVKDSYNTNHATANIVATNSIDSGNNTGWDFSSSPLATNNWIADTDSNWNNTANWSLSHVPTSGERAYFNSSHLGNCNIDTSINIAGLLISDYTATITQNSNSITIGTSAFIQNSGTFTGGDAAIGFSGDGSDLVINSGSFTATSGTMTFASMAKFIHSGGTFSHNSGTVVFSGTSSATLASIDIPNNGIFYNLTINLGSNGYNLKINSDDTVTVAGVLNTAVGKLSTGTVDLNGTLSSSATFGGGDGKILINDGQTVNISDGWMLPSIDLQNGTLNAPANGTMIFANAADFTIGESGIFNHNNGTIALIGSGGDSTIFTIDSPSSLEINSLLVNLANDAYNLAVATGDTLKVDGALTLTEGSFRSGIIDLNGTLSSSATFGGGDGKILINDGQTVNISDGWMLPSIDLQNGTLNAPANGTMIFANAADFTIGESGIFNHNNGTVAFYWKFASSTSVIDVQATEDFYNFTVDMPNNAYTLTITSGDSIIVNGTLGLNVGKVNTGTIEAKGDVVVESTFGGGNSPINFTGTGTQTMSVASGGILPSGVITVDKSGGSATISGTATIANNINLTAGTLNFAAGGSYTVVANKTITTSAGTNLRFAGESGSLVTLLSNTPGTRWNIADSGNVYANYVDVTDSNNSSGTIYALNTTQDNCVGWDTTSTAKTWDGGASTTVWNDGNNWNPDGAPDPNDTVTLDTANTITTNADINFGSLVLGGSNATTLQFTNNIGTGGSITVTGTGTLEQSNAVTQTILSDVVVQSGGTITHTANTTTEQYKLMLAVQGDIDLQSGGSINTDGKGYEKRSGPGASTGGQMGATYGGTGFLNTKNTYGSFENPTDLGSGGYNINESSGGGAAIIAAKGSFNVSGSVTSDGMGYLCCSYVGYGSGGSINISTKELTGNGIVRAKGGQMTDPILGGYGGGGGRISFAGVEKDSYSGIINANGSDAEDSRAGTIYLSPDKRANWTISNGQIYRLGSDGVNNYNFGNITIQSGGILELDSNPLMNDSGGGAATLYANNITIDEGGILKADGLGISSGGPGEGSGGMVGGTYGGKGYGNIKSGYGSIENPISLGSKGSGGNDSWGGYRWSSGGGAVILSLSGELTVNGTISANGLTSNTCASTGSGSGGSINITASILTGSSTGKIEAKGGEPSCNTGTGGGGRISFAGVTTDNFLGGVSVKTILSYDKGYAGTIYFNEQKRTSWTIANGQSYRLGTDGTNDYTFGNITIQSGGILEIDGDPTLNDGKGGAATINATNVTVESGGILKADELGFYAHSGPGYSGTQYSGGSYGGTGGNGGSTYGATYSPNPVYLGSGGYSGTGGGAVLLNVSETFTNAGIISANGKSNVSGNGAGGTINIKAGTINSNGGTITVNGGAKSGYCGGGGGRIVLRALDSYTSPSTLTANGGTGSPAGTNGSVYVNVSPSSAAISSPTNGATNQSQVKEFAFNATDTINCSVDGEGAGTCTPNVSDYLRYKLELADDSGFTTNNHTFTQGSDVAGQTVTDNGLTVAFSGQDSQGSTAYASGTTASATISSSTPLIQNHTYYVRISAIDPGGIDSFDGSAHYSSYSSVSSFTVSPIDKTVFTVGGGQTIRSADTSTCSSIITFEVRNAINEAVKMEAGRQATSTFILSDGEASGGFYSNSNCTTAIPSNQLTVANGSATASFYYKNTVSSSSTYTLTASETPSQGWSDASTTIQVNPGNLDHFTFTDYETTRTTDQTFSGTITAYDSLNNVKFDYYGSDAQIWFTSTADSYSYPAILPAKSSAKYQFQASDQGSKIFSNSFQLRKVGSHTITFHHDAYDNKSVDQLILNSATITVNPGEAFDFVLEDYPASTPEWSKYVISGSTWDIGGNGAPYDIKVTVKDQFSNTKTDYIDRKVWFELYDAQENQASYSFTYDTEGNAYSYLAGDAGIHTFSPAAFMSESSGRNMKFRVRNETIHHDFNIYVKPLGLDHFNIGLSEQISRDGTSWDQSVDSELSGESGPVSLTVTAYDVLGYVKTDYAANPDTGYGYIYFWSPDRSADDGSGNYLVNQELPYFRDTGDAADTSHCFAFPASSAGTHTFTGDDEIFKLYKGGRRKIYVSECIAPTSPYAISDLLKDDHIAGNWPGTNLVKSGVFPVTNPPETIAVATHVPGSTHLDDDHTDNANNNFTVGPGDQKLSLSWKNPIDVPANTDAKIHIFQSSNGVDFVELATPRPIINGAGMWQTQDISGLTNEQQYWFKLKAGFRRSDNSEILSDFSITMDGVPKAIAPIDVSATQLDRNDPENPGKVRVDFKLRFESTTTFSYFNPSNLSWNPITDSAISGEKGILSGNFDEPVSHVAYIDMNADFDGQYLATSFKVRVNVAVAGQGSSNSESPNMRIDTKNPSNATLVIDATNNTIANLTINADDDSNPIEMIISTKENFEGANWENYSTSKVDFDITGASHVYIKFRDMYFNDAEISTEIRPIPANLQIKDASNIATSKYRLVLIWDDAANVDHYNVWRSTDNINYQKIDTTTKNGYLDINLDTNNLYAYKVTSEDANHNISLPAGPVSSQPGAAPDVTAEPQVELFGWRQDSGVRAKITWNTDQLADSNVAHSTGEINSGADMTTKDGSSVQIAASPELTYNHEIWLYNLNPSAKYYFKAFSKNEIQIAGHSEVLSFTTPERVPLLIQGMEISDITIDSAVTSWSTSKLATTEVEYSNSAISGDSTPTGAIKLTDNNMNTDHTFKLENLSSGVKYYLRIKTTDADGNTTVSDIYTFETFAMPVISSVMVREVGYNSVTVEWLTNVSADSNVEFGVNSILSGTQGKADSTNLHSVSLIGLEPKTTYNYRVLSKDKFGNLATSAISSFTTATDVDAPKIIDVKSEVASTGSGESIKYQAIVSWDTDEPATSQIEFAMGIGGEYTDTTEAILSLNSSHVVILPDLKPNSAYHFRIKSIDKVGNVAYSDDISLITPPKEKSLLQVVLKSLEDTFSWVGRLRDKWSK
ncbi:MAG: Fibronectin type III domain protein [bacterium ADurb.Bin212]|nr:MAG: Fibronectin type III domain protein [bacterium ADurb.Bin212]